MSGLATSSSAGGAAPGTFLILPADGTGHPPVGNRGGEDRDVGRQRRLAGVQHLLRALDMRCTATPAGSGTDTGPLTSVTRAPSSASAAAIAWPCRPLERLAM